MSEFSEKLEAILKINAQLEAEGAYPPRWWYLTYAGVEGWRGAVLVQAPGFISAVVLASHLKINPGGEVRGIPVPEDKIPAPEFAYRLLTLDDVERAWDEPVKTIAEWEKDDKIN